MPPPLSSSTLARISLPPSASNSLMAVTSFWNSLSRSSTFDAVSGRSSMPWSKSAMVPFLTVTES